MPHNLQLRSHRGFLAERYDIFRRAGQHFVCVYQSLDIPSRRGTPHATLVPPKVRDLIAELHAAGFDTPILYTARHQAMGGTAGCRRLSVAFYSRVQTDPLLRPLFPGKTLHCAIEEFTAFLVQLFGGPSGDAQRRHLARARREGHHLGQLLARRPARDRHVEAARRPGIEHVDVHVHVE